MHHGLEPLNDALELGKISVAFLKVVEGEPPVIWSKIEVIRIVIHNRQIFDDFRPFEVGKKVAER